MNSTTEQPSKPPLSLLSLTDVAIWLDVSPNWVRQHAVALKARRIGKLIKFRHEDVEEFLRFNVL